ncbi:MAG: methyl-accepting chemotaxis protein [Halapricum sp.]
MRYVLPERIRKRYGLKLILSFLVVIVVIGAIGGYIYLRTGDQLTRDAEQRMGTRALDHANALDTWVNNSESTTRVVSSALTAEARQDTVQQYLSSLVEQGDLTDGVRAVHYVNTDSGEILASSLQSRVGANPRQEGAPWAQKDMGSIGDSAVLETTFQPTVANTTVAAFVSPVPDVDNRALVYVTNVSAIADHLRQASKTAYTRVVDSQGTIVLDQKGSGTVGTQYSTDRNGVSTGAIQNAIDGGTGYALLSAGQTPSGEGERIVGYAPTKTLDWAVVVHDDPTHVFSLKRDISMGLVALLVAAVLGLGAIGLTIGRSTLDSIDTLSSKAATMESGDLDVEMETDRADEIGDLFRSFASMRDSLRERIAESQNARAEAEASEQAAQEAREETEALLDHLESKADDYGAVMRATADGDLTQRMDPSEENEAMAAIARSYNRMIDELARTVSEVQSFAERVSATSEDVTASTEEIEAASQQVANSVQEIAAGADQQSDNLQETVDEMNDLSATIEEIAASAEQLAADANGVAETGTTGREKAAAATDEIEQIETRAEQAATQVASLDEEMVQIEEIVQLITEIAEQTNMLALNASIEAARAGEAGEGFAVVADEIKGLAGEAAEATNEIEDRIETVQETTAEAVADMEAMNDSVETGSRTVEEAIDVFEEIATSIEEIRSGVGEISDATDDQAASTEEVVTMIDEVSSVAEQTAAEASNVSAATEEQASSVTGVSDNAQTLTQKAEELRDLVEQFETDDEPDSREDHRRNAQEA